MSKITLCRQDFEFPIEAVRALLQALDGFTHDDKKSWRLFWRRALKAEPGELFFFEIIFQRSGPFHRRHMKIERRLFESQERFDNFESMRVWLKIGAEWVIWAAGPKGGVVPIPKSISYRKADEAEFRQFHEQLMRFLHGPHAAKYLWPHLSEFDQRAMMEQVLSEFGE